MTDLQQYFIEQSERWKAFVEERTVFWKAIVEEQAERTRFWRFLFWSIIPLAFLGGMVTGSMVLR